MAKDKRLYMTFPNDFWMHPKIAPLSVDAKWAFVEMNGYSRMQDLDGRIPAVMMHRMWPAEVVAELCASHAERPLMFHDEAADVYVIRDYAQHQQTTADREELSEKRSIAGKAGRAKQLADNSGASVGQVSGQNWAETETETETELTRSKDLSVTGFDSFAEFWHLWPRSEGKAAAGKAWAKAVKMIDPTLLLELVRVYVAYPNRPDVEFIPHASTWLNGERWNDGPPVARSNAQRLTKDVRALTLIEQGRAMDEADERKALSA